MPRPLEGKRIVITRSREQSAGFAKRLVDLGAEPIVVPTIQFVEVPSPALDDALQVIDQYDWLLLTSANAVKYFWQKLRSIPFVGDLPPIAVVGSATAAAVETELGVSPARMPRKFVAEEMVHELGELEGKRILLPRSSIGREELVDLLKSKGALVDDISIYDTVPVEHLEEELTQVQRRVDAITFTSPSSVRNFMDILDRNGLSRSVLEQSVVACIGPVTAAAAEDEEISVLVVPEVHTIAGLVDSLVEYFADLEDSEAAPTSKASHGK